MDKRFLPLFLSLLLLSLQPTLLAEDTHLHRITTGDTAESLAERYLGGSENADELLRFNGLKKGASLNPGRTMIIPMEVRNEALKTLAEAERALAIAQDEMAEQYAPSEYSDALGTYKSAVEFRKLLDYVRSAGYSRVCVKLCDIAVQQARINALIEQDAIISAVAGTVQTSADGSTWKGAKPGARLPVASHIRTEEKSRAEITFADGSKVQVVEQSELKVEQFLLDRRTGIRASKLNVILGEIMGEITPRDKKDSTFEIKSRDGIMAIRGTGIRFESDQDDETLRVSVLHGAAELSARNRSVNLPEGFGSYVKRNKPPAKPQELLPAPNLGTSLPDASLTPLQKFDLVWNPVRDRKLDGYLMELSRDTGFNDPVMSVSTKAPYASTLVLPEDEYFWRVASVDHAGLVGAFTTPRSFSVKKVTGVNLVPRSRVWKTKGKQVISGDNHFEITVNETPSSVVETQYRINGGEYVSARELRIDQSGPTKIEVRGIAADGVPGKPSAFHYLADVDAPVINVKQTRTTEHGTDWIDVEAVATDASPSLLLEMRFPGSPWLQYPGTIRISAAEASEVQFRATDAFDNLSETRTIRVN